MNIDKKLLEKQIKILALQLNKDITKKERDAFEGLLNMLGDIADNKAKSFPNGFTSWMETHHEIVSGITQVLGKDIIPKAMDDYYSNVGSVGMYQLAERLTDKFEAENIGVEWGINKEFIDTIEYFIDKELENL